MSLINEALKRAKEAQQQAPTPSSAPKLRPVEPAQQRRPRLGLLLPVAVAGIALLAVVLVRQIGHRQNPTELAAATPPVSALETPPGAPPPAVAATPVEQPAAAPAPAVVAAASAPIPSAPPAVLTSGTMTPAPVPATAAASVTNAPLALPAPKPAPLKLQAIVFDPARPSAIISGKTVAIGGRVGEFRVAAIARESVTLVAPGRTNVLNLSE